MIKAATHDELKEAFGHHLEETERQITRLEAVFQAFGVKPTSKNCEAMTGLIREAEEISSENHGEQTINAALISAAQKVEHYEIASYGCLREWAEQLGQDSAAELLEETLDEEKAADQALTDLARNRCNRTAQEGETESEEDDSAVQPSSRAYQAKRVK